MTDALPAIVYHLALLIDFTNPATLGKWRAKLRRLAAR
jgi:hypothetical protein